MSIFTFLDLGFYNSYYLLLKIDPDMYQRTHYREFKRIISQGLCTGWRLELQEKKNKKIVLPPPCTVNTSINEYIGSTCGTNHVLLENQDNCCLNCFLCQFLSTVIDGIKITPK